ncbi:AAA family ATPase [Gluconobacter frateurii]|uniref:SMC domain-containing protein n=1 Tax=Gluconobacter frateurii NRIC 0228 TaxID=1307946 RepID=A0ABQ0QER8_9PROT|nr:AAA family ATPase [Gluconobacter frateurii]GBR16118.1 SMC domain-containing protein [Gluconobacter frateurii NRIC 0228]GLP90487.1 nuclease SbcCD subunit C [Gluconobacter frateurii]
MQILAIRGSNLASLAGSFEVNFSTGVLADAGIFAITGPTGAGKSTLLDAISLALFDTIPRLESAPKTGQITQDDIGPQDPRAILRHGAGHGFAELDFMGRDGRSYRSRWTVRRARERADGKLQASTLDLECLDTGERLGGKKTETKAEILRLVGLNAQQFGRAVVLAQGEFEAFIKADGDERAQLLEKLTGADIYSRVGRLAFEKARDVRAGYDSLERQIAAMNGLDTEAREGLEEEQRAAQTAHDEKLAVYEQLQNAQNWHNRLADLKAKRDEAVQACEAARKACENAAPRVIALNRHKQALTHLGAWGRLRDAEERVRQAERAALQAQQTEQSAIHALTNAENTLETARQALDAAKATQQNAAADIQIARQLDMELKHVAESLDLAKITLQNQAEKSQIADATLTKVMQAVREAQLKKNELTGWLNERSELAKLVPFEAELVSDFKAHKRLFDQLSELTETEHLVRSQHAEAEAQVQRTKDTFDSAAQTLKSSENATRQAEADAPRPEKFEDLTSRIRAIENIQRKNLEVQRFHEDLQTAEATYAKTVDDIQRLTAEQAEHQSELKQLDAQLPTLSAILKEARRSEEHCRNTTSDAAVLMRAALVDGEACPVCGSIEHHLNALDAMLGSALEIAQKRTADATNALETARERVTVLKTWGENARQRLCQLQAQQDDQSKTKEACRAAWQSGVDHLAHDCQAYGLNNQLSGVTLTDETEKCLTALEQEQAAFNTKITALDAVRKAERTARTDCDTARQSYEAAESHCRALENGLKEAAHKLLHAETEQKRLEKQLDDRLSGMVAWRDFSEDPAVWLSRTLEAWRQKNDALLQLENDWPSLHAAQVCAESEVQSAKSALTDVQTDWQTKQDVHQALSQKRLRLLEGQSVESVVERLGGAVKAAEDAFQAALGVRNTLSEDAVGAKTRREGAEKLFEDTQKELIRFSEGFDAQLAMDGFGRSEIQDAEGLGPEYVAAEEKILFELTKTHSDACATLKPRESDYAEHEASRQAAFDIADLEPQLLRAKAAVTDAKTALTRLEARILQDDETRFQTAELRTQLDAKRAEGHVWEQLGDMLGDAQGKRFRNFAQSLTLDHLLDFANERLADLKPRYTLQRAPAGEMLIEVIDNDMGGLVRGLQNLSGGERFLVSLALALGLSEMSTGRGIRIESLFIDEGFGALDSASLGQAIAVLEHLQAQGRRVGVISHVEELKERIPVKVEVTPVSGGKSQIAIVVD